MTADASQFPRGRGVILWPQKGIGYGRTEGGHKENMAVAGRKVYVGTKGVFVTARTEGV